MSGRSPTVRSGLRCLAEASGRACDSAARPDDHQQARHEPTTRWIQAQLTHRTTSKHSAYCLPISMPCVRARLRMNSSFA